jgi:hypothetical protein
MSLTYFALNEIAGHFFARHFAENLGWLVRIDDRRNQMSRSSISNGTVSSRVIEGSPF